MQAYVVPSIFEGFVSNLKKLQHNFPKMMGGCQRQFGFFSENLSVLVPWPVPVSIWKQQLHKKWKYLLFHKCYCLQFSFHYISQNSGELFPKGPASNSIILKKVTFFQGIRQSEPRDPRSSKVYKVIRIQLQQSKEGGGGGTVFECFQSSWSGFNEFSCLLLMSIVRKGGYWLNVLWHKHKLKNRKK